MMRSMLCLIVFMLASGHQSPRPVQCSLAAEGSRWAGSCGPLFGEQRTMSIAPSDSIRSGMWRRDARPMAVWAGEMSDSGLPNDRIEIEIYRGGPGILRTANGWLPISHFSADVHSVRMSIDTSRTIPPSELDRQIIVRAASLLSADSLWNRADNRQCAPNARTWSIYCAMERATIDVTGGFHHRRPALEFVRKLIELRSEGRPYHHRLMDYNNDPTTHLADVQSLFAEALKKIGH